MTLRNLSRFLLVVATANLAACTEDGFCEINPADPGCCQLCQNDPDQRLCYKNSEHNGICNEPTCDCTASNNDGGTPDAGPQDAGPPCGGCAAPTAVCDPTTNQCVECLGDADCGDPTSARCQNRACTACTGNAQCAHLAGAPICNLGTCIACTETETAACTTGVCKPDGSCSQHPATQNVCQPCDTDRNCQTGQLCVTLTYDNPTTGAVVGTFCQWRQDANQPSAPSGQCASDTNLNAQPWAQLRSDTTSVDGTTANICTLRTTTCPAFLHHTQQVGACSDAEVVDGTATVDLPNDACGAPAFNDARCRYRNPDATPPAQKQPRCTYPCLGTEDCKPGSTCPTTGEQYCSI